MGVGGGVVNSDLHLIRVYTVFQGLYYGIVGTTTLRYLYLINITLIIAFISNKSYSYYPIKNKDILILHVQCI